MKKTKPFHGFIEAEFIFLSKRYQVNYMQMKVLRMNRTARVFFHFAHIINYLKLESGHLSVELNNIYSYPMINVSKGSPQLLYLVYSCFVRELIFKIISKESLGIFRIEDFL